MKFKFFTLVVTCTFKSKTTVLCFFSIFLSFQRDMSLPIFRVVIVYFSLNAVSKFCWCLMFLQNSPFLLRNSCVQCIATGKLFRKFITYCEKIASKNIDDLKQIALRKLDIFIVLSKWWSSKSEDNDVYVWFRK